MDLILWRHAEAVTGHHDLARTLTVKGEQQAKRMAAWLKHRLPETTSVWVSQARRSQQTAAYFSRHADIQAALNPDALATDILPLLYAHNGSHLLCIGHQPWIGQICAHLLAGHPYTERYWSVKKGAIWWFSLDTDHIGLHSKLKASLCPSLL